MLPLSIETRLDAIGHDRLRGASALALDAAALLRDVAGLGDPALLAGAARAIAAAQPAMAPLLRLARMVSACATPREAARASSAFRERILTAGPRIAALALELCRPGE